MLFVAVVQSDTIRLTVDGVGEELKEAGPGHYSSAEDLHNLNIGWRDFSNDTNTYKRNTNANRYGGSGLLALFYLQLS